MSGLRQHSLLPRELHFHHICITKMQHIFWHYLGPYCSECKVAFEIGKLSWVLHNIRHPFDIALYSNHNLDVHAQLVAMLSIIP
jgi:hypothetical protein